MTWPRTCNTNTIMKFQASRPRRDGQTFVFFLVAFVTVFLLCGLGLDSGLYYLSKVRLQRATDASVITGVQNFYRPVSEVSTVMRNIAVANYLDLADISETPQTSTATTPLGETEYIYAYLATDDDGNITHALTNTITRAAEGNITEAKAKATAPYETEFMKITGIAQVTDLDMVATSVAERRPRLITLVLDRSGSMIRSGSRVLPSAVTNFLGDGSGVGTFDQSSDEIAIVSYSSFARNEMPHTTNFVEIGSNLMWKADGNNKNGKQRKENPTGMKFSGVTAADEGMRVALEQMRIHPAYNNDQYDKYIVFMTDGAFNSVRSLYASPTFTNRIMMATDVVADDVSHYGATGLSSRSWAQAHSGDAAYINHQQGGDQESMWTNYFFQLPNLTSFTDTNMMVGSTNNFAVPKIIMPETIGNDDSRVGGGLADSGKVRGTVNVWLMPGSVAIHQNVGADGSPGTGDEVFKRNYFSYYTNSAVNIPLDPGDYVDLVMPGYVVDAVNSGFLTMRQRGKWNSNPDNAYKDKQSHWPSFPKGEDPGEPTVGSDYFSLDDPKNNPNWRSLYRNWNMRNAANLMWDFVMLKPEDIRWDGQESYVQPPESSLFSYPGGMYMWTLNNRVSGTGSNIQWEHTMMSTNLLSTTPRFAGNTFFSKNGQLELADDWLNNAPGWLTNQFNSVMSVQKSPNPAVTASDHDYPVWRPRTYNGDMTPDTVTGRQQVDNMTNHLSATAPTAPLDVVDGVTNTTGGWAYVFDDAGTRHLRMNTMGFNSRPMYYYNQEEARWDPLETWSEDDIIISTGNWKAKRYAEVARSEDITVYTINFVNGNEGILQNMANDPRSPSYDRTQPEGEQITAANGNELSAAFEEISKKIRATLIQ